MSKISRSDIVQTALALARAERDLAEISSMLDSSRDEAIRAWEKRSAAAIKRRGDLAFRVARLREAMRRIVDALDAEVDRESRP